MPACKCLKFKALVFLFAHQSLLAQLPDPNLLGTGLSASGQMLSIGSLDPAWLVARGDSLQPTEPFVNALVSGNCNDLWPQPLQGVNWIGHDSGNGCNQTGGCSDFYFMRRLQLPALNGCGVPVQEHYCLDIEFQADNCVYAIWVNGIPNYHFQEPGDPYQYDGQEHPVSGSLCYGWHEGENVILVQVKSCPIAAGLSLRIYSPLSTPQHFLGMDTVLCMSDHFTMTGPSPNTHWFDFTTASEKTVHHSGQYWAYYTDSGGCEIRDTLNVAFEGSYYVPNVFSPNDDGHNDQLKISFSDDNFQKFKFQVLDRWGNLVFESESPTNQWDGMFQGRYCAPGVYLYRIQAERGACRVQDYGDILIVR